MEACAEVSGTRSEKKSAEIRIAAHVFSETSIDGERRGSVG